MLHIDIAYIYMEYIYYICTQTFYATHRSSRYNDEQDINNNPGFRIRGYKVVKSYTKRYIDGWGNKMIRTLCYWGTCIMLLTKSWLYGGSNIQVKTRNISRS